MSGDDQQNDAANPLMVVVSGPSGVGKDTLLERMEELHSGLNFHFVVTATTREPRADEADGVNHHFLNRDQFQDMIRNDELLEWAEVYGNYYGVPKAQVTDALAAGKHVLCRVDVQGAARIRTLVPEALFVFVLPPDKDALRRRLMERGQDSEESIERRLKAAQGEIEQASRFDEQLINHDGRLDEIVEELVEIIETESRRDPPR
ncbi:MAG: guanylate kinase, partial [Chloroflexi bacterium]|nr:guanylate kinase [Chloroflexota bacterium]